MNKTKKLLSVLLAVIMALSCMSVMASAAKTNYKTVDELTALKAYSPYGQVTRLSTEERTSIIFDWLDNTLAKANINMGTLIDVLGLKVTINLTSIDNLCASFDTIHSTFNNTLFGIAKGIVNLGILEDVNVDPWQTGMSRAGTAQFTILSELVEVISAQSGIIYDVVSSGNLDLGIIGGALGDISAVTDLIGDIPGLIKGLVFPLIERWDDTLSLVQTYDTRSKGNGNVTNTVNERVKKLFSDDMSITTIKYDVNGKMTSEHTRWTSFATGSAAPAAPTANSPRCYYQFSSTTPGSVMTVYHIVDAAEAKALAKTPDEINGSPAAYTYFKEKQTFVMTQEVEGSDTYVWKATDEWDNTWSLKWYNDNSQLLPGFSGDSIDLTTMSAGELLYTFIPVLFNDMAPVVLNGSVKKILAEFFGAKFTRVGTVVEDGSAWVLDEKAAAAIPDADEAATIFTTEQGDYMFEWSDYAVVNGNHYYRYLDDIYVGDISAKNNYFDIINWEFKIDGTFMNEFIPTGDDDASKRLLLNLNDFLVKVATTITKASAETADTQSDYTKTWTRPTFKTGSNAYAVENIKAAAQAVISLAPQHIFGSDYATNERCYYDLLMSSDNDTVLTGIAAMLVDIIMPSMSLPGKSDILESGAKVGAILAAVIREFAAYLIPEYNFDALIYTDFGATDGVKNFVTGKDSEYWFDVCLTMGINAGFEYLRAFADMGEGTAEWDAFVAYSGYGVDGKTYAAGTTAAQLSAEWEGMLDYLIDWALDKDYEWTWKIENLVEVDGLTIDMTTAQNPFQKIDKILFGLIPFDEILDIKDYSGYRSGTRFEKFLRYDLILGIVDLRWDALVGTIAFPATDANYFRDGGVLGNLATLLKRIVNGIFDKVGGGSYQLIPSAVTTFDNLANQGNIATLARDLVSKLHTALVTNKLADTVFPFLGFLLGWKTDPQQIADPQIWTSFRDGNDYAFQWKDNGVYPTIEADTTLIKILNNSAGMLETHRNSDVTDHAYDIQIKSVTSDATVNTLKFTYGDGNGLISPYETLDIKIGGTYKGEETTTITIAYDYVGKDGVAIGGTQYTSLTLLFSNQYEDANISGRFSKDDDNDYAGTDDFKRYQFTEDIYETVVNYQARIFYVGSTLSNPSKSLGTIAAPDWETRQRETGQTDCNGNPVMEDYQYYFEMSDAAKKYFAFRAADSDAGWAGTLSKDGTTETYGYLYKAANGTTADTEIPYGTYYMGRIAVAYGKDNKQYEIDFIHYNDYDIYDIYTENQWNGYNANQGVSADLYNEYNAAWKDIVKYATYPMMTEANGNAATDYVKTIQPYIPAAIERFEAAKKAYEEALADAQASGAGAALPAYIQSLQAEIDNDFMNGKEINFQDYAFYEYFNYNDVKVAAENLYRSYLQPEVMDTYYILNSGIREAELDLVAGAEASASKKAGILASRLENNADAIAASQVAHDEWKMPVTTKLVADDFTSRLAYYKQFLNSANREANDHLKFLEKEIAFVEAQNLNEADYETVTWGRYAKALADAKAVAAGTDEFASFNSRIYDVKYNLMVAYKQLLKNADSLIQAGGTADLLANIETAEAIFASMDANDGAWVLKEGVDADEAYAALISALGYKYQARYSKNDVEVQNGTKNAGDLKYNEDGSPMIFDLYADSAYEYAENDRPNKQGNQAKVNAANAKLVEAMANFEKAAVEAPELGAVDGTTGAFGEVVTDEETGFTTGYIYGVTVGDAAEKYFELVDETAGTVEWTLGTASNVNGTGAIATVKDTKGNAVAEFTLVIFGDVDGDGGITPTDAATVKVATVGGTIDGDAFNMAADVDGDGGVTPTDSATVKVATVGGDITVNPYVA